MRFIEHLRKDATCYYASELEAEDKAPVAQRTFGPMVKVILPTAFNISEVIDGVFIFDANRVARQMCEKITINSNNWSTNEFSQKGLRLSKWSDQGDRFAYDKYFGIIPPHPRCWFEFSLEQFYEPGEFSLSDVSDYGVFIADEKDGEVIGLMYGFYRGDRSDPLTSSIGVFILKTGDDGEILHISTALETLKKAVITSIRDKVVSMEVGMRINGQLAELDQAISSAFPASASDEVSLARLPF
jgi:hypothetical protein